ncbi:O-antigen/teichoic acid export membrane protein [Pseudarthrobacter oxydans]|uniref:O-antigen/teichoic acid export membrane protein n=1 Tax=Pseudarthrobacter oxydans TaxID=1671 RepID=A0AAW8N6N2_PSEOX|nr:O-antigen/teichoic acid export membrane protein [Pseudarthrobacter oxydans]MDR7162615.1 O-antigen/teichoic acid export membrane protein [Pseudarthrobacter oxydans]
MASILPILAFFDLGFGGAATNWATEYGNSPTAAMKAQLQRRLQRALVTAGLPVLCGILLSVFLASWGLRNDYKWLDIPIAVLSITLALYFLSVPSAIISKLLIGMGRSSTWIIIQVLQPLTALGFAALSIGLNRHELIPITPALSLLTMCSVGAYFGLRSIRTRLKDVMVSRSSTSVREPIFAAAWPMLIILIANPLALSSDRLLLSWFGSPSDVATYSLGAQLFAPALALLSTMGMSLWPHFAKKRFHGSNASPWPMTIIFTLAALVGSALLLALSPWLASVISGGQIILPLLLLLCLSASFVVQAAQLPIGMYMMHGSGPKFQAGLLVVMFMMKFVLSLLWIPLLGAGGPALATAASILFCQVAPGVYLVVRKIA